MWCQAFLCPDPGGGDRVPPAAWDGGPGTPVDRDVKAHRGCSAARKGHGHADIGGSAQQRGNNVEVQNVRPEPSHPRFVALELRFMAK